MKIACSMIIVLVATALVGVSSRTIHEPAINIRADRDRQTGGAVARSYGAAASSGGTAVGGGGTAAMRTAVGGDQGRPSEELRESCMTAEHCSKKKVVCVKKCTTEPLRGGVGADHLPPKCTVHCKKCVPDC